MTSPSKQWVRHDWAGSADDFHAAELPATRAMWWCQVDSPALILGSTQLAEDIDPTIASQLGVSVVRRRSGGGAVYVHPADSIWIDITIGRDDPLWIDDVGQSMLWLGNCFVDALRPWCHAETYHGPFVGGVDGRAVCFASTSPGEVFVEEKKLIGISQRRGRDGARFQCVMYRQWQPDEWATAIADPEVQDRLGSMAVATLDVPARDILDSVFTHLSGLGGERSGEIWG